MSAIMLGLAFKANMGTVNRKAVLLKLADHAHDDGTNIYPSVARIADETHLSVRTVQRVLAELVEVDLLHLVAYEGGGRGNSRNYMLNVQMLQTLALGKKGATQSPFKKGVTDGKRVTEKPKRVTYDAVKGDKLCHPNHQEPSINISDMFSDFWSAYPRKENRRQAEVEFNHAAETNDPIKIIAGAKAFAVMMAKQGREPKFIKLPAGWLADQMWLDVETSGFDGNSQYRMITLNDPEWEPLLAEREAAGSSSGFMRKYGSIQVPAEYKPGAGQWRKKIDGAGFHWAPNAGSS